MAGSSASQGVDGSNGSSIGSALKVGLNTIITAKAGAVAAHANAPAPASGSAQALSLNKSGLAIGGTTLLLIVAGVALLIFLRRK